MKIVKNGPAYYPNPELATAKALDIANALAICKELYAVGEIQRDEYVGMLHELMDGTSYKLYIV